MFNYLYFNSLVINILWITSGDKIVLCKLIWNNPFEIYWLNRI